jgi:hypothetical protein
MSLALGINIKPKRVFLSLTAVLFLLILCHVIGMLFWYSDVSTSESWYYISLFDLDEEESIGTWFNAFILFFAAQLLFLIGKSTAITNNRFGFYWLFLATGFLILSVDEIAGFHELLNTVLEDTHWTFYGLILTGALGLAFIPFLLNLPKKYSLLFIVSGLTYLGGAIGIEYATISYEDNDEIDTLAYNLWNAVEEGMEMFGVILFLTSITSYLNLLIVEKGLKIGTNDEI